MQRHALFCAAAVASALLTASPAAAAVRQASINFDSISSPVSPTGEGLVVGTLTSGSGISGDPMPGSVGVFGDSQDPAITSNAALVFDATCSVDGASGTPSGCSGGDADLFQPALRNVLIVAENLHDRNANGRIDDPDDADLAGQSLAFDFGSFADGAVQATSIEVLDVETVEPGGYVSLRRAGAEIGQVPLPVTGDGGRATVPLGNREVDQLVVVLGGSAAIDELRVRDEDRPPDEQLGGQGCTPGYWKNHTDRWQGAAPGDLFDSTFGVSYSPGLTLLGALNSGGGGFERLGRHATAGLLNARHSGVDYALSSAQVIALVQEAFASGNPTPAGNRLEAANEAGCPLGGTRARK